LRIRFGMDSKSAGSFKQRFIRCVTTRHESDPNSHDPRVRDCSISMSRTGRPVIPDRSHAQWSAAYPCRSPQGG
jgi:hypothetical protein